MSVIHCYIMLLSLITAGVMVFLITCALIGIVALIVKHKMVATKNVRGKILLLSYINCLSIALSIATEEATNVIYDYIDMTLPATTVTSNTIPTEPNTAYATTLHPTKFNIKTDTNIAYSVVHSSSTSST